MKSNETLQKNVQDAIKWEPHLYAAEIGVTVKDGVVTLSGTVDTYAKKSEAEDAVKHVSGVKAVIEKIQMKQNHSDKKENAEIVNEVLNAFKWNWEIPNDTIRVKVEDGWVTLEGELEWNYQKEAARKVVKNLIGIKGLTNDIIVKSKGNDKIEKKDIENALTRNGSIDDEDIEVNVSGNKVTLSGSAYSLFQKEEAGRIAWNAPGVWEVKNELVVEYDD